MNVTTQFATLFLACATSIFLSACASLDLRTDTTEPSVPKVTENTAEQGGTTITASSPIAHRCDITQALAWMAEQHIPYTQSPRNEWRDCSGNFLRLSSRIASQCPDVTLAAPPGISRYTPNGDNSRPGKEKARSTRGLAYWYDQQGTFVPIYYDNTDPLDAPDSLVRLRNRIQVGTVLWYSPGVPLAAEGKTGLYREVGGAINHMGTVVSVTHDADGNVRGWRMYHGRNKRTHNGITNHVWARSGRSKPVPQGGYGQQRIVGFAEHIIPEYNTSN